MFMVVIFNWLILEDWKNVVSESIGALGVLVLRVVDGVEHMGQTQTSDKEL